MRRQPFNIQLSQNCLIQTLDIYVQIV